VEPQIDEESPREAPLREPVISSRWFVIVQSDSSKWNAKLITGRPRRPIALLILKKVFCKPRV